MMKYCIILVIIVAVRTFGLCQSKDSRVIDFYYGGFSDTSVAMLKVTSNLDELEVKILSKNIVFDDNKIKSNEYLGFSHGYWDLQFSMKGFDTILIKDYYALPDQVSRVQLYLSRGKEKVIYTTKPPSYLFPKNGSDSTFFENGQLNQTSTYRNDTLIYQSRYYQNGSLKYKKELLDNGLTSSIKYYENGQLEFIAFWNKVTTEGYRKEFFEDGRLKEHLLNTQEGQLRWYSTDSTGTVTIERGNTLIDYRIKNDIDTTINVYRSGLKDGKWIYHRSDGSLLWIEEYKYGKKVLFEHYSSDGNLTKRVIY
ncbi:MAG: hypothetical protein MK066_10070 [Crocinitomicaceae bacterium]|nr:hypothetical protein [Crocinitomicaceae bacterium]